jgi:hypothetical protein
MDLTKNISISSDADSVYICSTAFNQEREGLRADQAGPLRIARHRSEHLA